MPEELLDDDDEVEPDEDDEVDPEELLDELLDVDPPVPPDPPSVVSPPHAVLPSAAAPRLAKNIPKKSFDLMMPPISATAGVLLTAE